ncbi:hypothetical protein P154DRAFT_521384 [Amniculicola lignicola CBS 123094]|uniref:GDP-mannose transporter n=1 Tax=Amniculicola lignicola CBS 123094 TaxID=1392246 RepID=A0A6A5WKE2_9PLEO|nr:hypothetical protein P154DRAFT_521384 [Amniculicola lignicola CBS 123094]
MNSTRSFTRGNSNVFRPAFEYLNNFTRSSQLPRDHPHKKSDAYYDDLRHHRRKASNSSSLDDTDNEDVEQYAQMEASSRISHSAKSSRDRDNEGLQPAIPLIDISRSPSPYPRSRSAVQSEDEDDEFELASSIRPLVSSDVGSGGGNAWRGIWKQGGLGGFLFGTWLGWQIWVGLLVFWYGGCSFGLLLMNRFIVSTGVYKFPYPLAGTYLQLFLTHLFLIGFSSFTRAFGTPLRRIGFGAAVAPAYPVASHGSTYRNSNKQPSIFQFGRWLSNGSGGIAGGGLFEFDKHIAKQCLPAAVVFVVKVLLSNFSFAYAPLPVYQLARIGITPLSLILTCLLQKESHSASTLSSALIATLNLLFATLRSNVRVTWESIVAGVFSSLFVALYPILLLRTYRTILAGLIPQGDILTGYPSSDDTAVATNKEETRAYFRTLHYISLLSLMLLAPILLIWGDLPAIYHNIPFLDVPFFWLMIYCGSLGSFAVFTSTLLMVKATSPLTTTFVSVPRSAFQLGMVSLFKMPVNSWVGISLCWASSLWYLLARRGEGRRGERARLEGR